VGALGRGEATAMDDSNRDAAGFEGAEGAGLGENKPLNAREAAGPESVSSYRAAPADLGLRRFFTR
jgi:hypothetical protein